MVSSPCEVNIAIVAWNITTKSTYEMAGVIFRFGVNRVTVVGSN